MAMRMGKLRLLSSAGILSGTLVLGQTPQLPAGLVWHLNVGTHLVALAVMAGPSGDYNGDGVVDAADYTVWRDTLGQTGTGLAADGNHNNVIDSGDYDVWKSNYGTSAGNGASATSTVPEPCGLLLCLVGLTLWGIRGFAVNRRANRG